MCVWVGVHLYLFFCPRFFNVLDPPAGNLGLTEGPCGAAHPPLPLCIHALPKHEHGRSPADANQSQEANIRSRGPERPFLSTSGVLEQVGKSLFRFFQSCKETVFVSA